MSTPSTDREYLQTTEQWTRFLSALTHELRTPLASLRMLAELLAGSVQGNQERRYAENVQEVVREIQTLVGDVAELSRLLAGRIQARPDDVALAPLVEQVEEIVRPVAWERGTALKASLDPALPRLLRVDADHLRRTLALLLGVAASQAESEASLRLDLHGESLRAVISSDGPPFADAALPRLFEPFEDGARRRGGRSLALPLANELARSLGAALLACNRGGRATFELTLPLAGA